MILIKNCSLFIEDKIRKNCYLIVLNDKIKEFGQMENLNEFNADNIIDAKGELLIPGFIDIHVNGGGGHLVVDANIDALKKFAYAHAKNGTTCLLATTISVSEEQLIQTILSISDYIEDKKNIQNIYGLHLEGPFLSIGKAGAHKKEFLKEPSIDYLTFLLNKSNNNIKLISLAPELPNALDLIKFAISKGLKVGLAHSEANYQITKEAINHGLSFCTHLFNGMLPFTHKDAGPIGAFLTDDSTYIELITDGKHVTPPAMLVTIKAKGLNNVIIVTDAVNPAGTDMKTFSILGTELEVKGYSCYVPGNGLAGSALTMNIATKTLIETTGINFEDAIKMSTINPARFLGIDNCKGLIKVGYDADLILINKDINVLMTIINGVIVYKN